ncbi:MAG: hypothetical protein M3Q58_14480 [Bacteroidota bacterium]|nr:hypothetical protein [Bacteroidota bacterium]
MALRTIRIAITDVFIFSNYTLKNFKRSTISFVFIISFFAPIVNAQNTGEIFYKKGRNLAGFQPRVGFGKEKIIGFYNFRYGHFFIDKLITGVDLNYGDFGSYSKEYSFGPYIRYCFFSSRINVFSEINYNYGLGKGIININNQEKNYNYTFNSIGLSSGISYTGIFNRRSRGFSILLHIPSQFI